MAITTNITAMMPRRSQRAKVFYGPLQELHMTFSPQPNLDSIYTQLTIPVSKWLHLEVGLTKLKGMHEAHSGMYFMNAGMYVRMVDNEMKEMPVTFYSGSSTVPSPLLNPVLETVEEKLKRQGVTMTVQEIVAKHIDSVMGRAMGEAVLQVHMGRAKDFNGALGFANAAMYDQAQRQQYRAQSAMIDTAILSQRLAIKPAAPVEPPKPKFLDNEGVW